MAPPCSNPASSTTTCMYVMGGGFGHSNLPQGKGGMQQREALDFRSLDLDISAFVPDSHSHYASSWRLVEKKEQHVWRICILISEINGFKKNTLAEMFWPLSYVSWSFFSRTKAVSDKFISLAIFCNISSSSCCTRESVRSIKIVHWGSCAWLIY